MSHSDLPKTVEEFISISGDLFDAINVYEIAIKHLKANPSFPVGSEFEHMQQNCRRLAIRARKIERQLMSLGPIESTDEAKFCKLAIEEVNSQMADFINLLAEMNSLKNTRNLSPEQKQSNDQQ